MFSSKFSIRGRKLVAVKCAGIVAILAAWVMVNGSAAQGQAPTTINLTGTWVGNGGSETTFAHSGSVLNGTSWGGKGNPTLTGSMKLTGGQGRPVIYRGTYEGRNGKMWGSGTITITVHDQNRIFVSYTGTVTDGRQSTPVSDSGFATRK